MITVADAIRIVIKQTRCLPTEQIPLAGALSRILAEDISADSDLPPFDRSQRDGYAVRAADVASEVEAVIEFSRTDWKTCDPIIVPDSPRLRQWQWTPVNGRGPMSPSCRLTAMTICHSQFWTSSRSK